VIAKLENEKAVEMIDDILKQKIIYGVFVPRGILGTVMPVEKITWTTKYIIKKCNHAAKTCILAS
jgi:pyruvate kinase